MSILYPNEKSDEISAEVMLWVDHIIPFNMS
jgi:hypothetical protein